MPRLVSVNAATAEVGGSGVSPPGGLSSQWGTISSQRSPSQSSPVPAGASASPPAPASPCAQATSTFTVDGKTVARRRPRGASAVSATSVSSPCRPPVHSFATYTPSPQLSHASAQAVSPHTLGTPFPATPCSDGSHCFTVGGSSDGALTDPACSPQPPPLPPHPEVGGEAAEGEVAEEKKKKKKIVKKKKRSLTYVAGDGAPPLVGGEEQASPSPSPSPTHEEAQEAASSAASLFAAPALLATDADADAAPSAASAASPSGDATPTAQPTVAKRKRRGTHVAVGSSPCPVSPAITSRTPQTHTRDARRPAPLVREGSSRSLGGLSDTLPVSPLVGARANHSATHMLPTSAEEEKTGEQLEDEIETIFRGMASADAASAASDAQQLRGQSPCTASASQPPPTVHRARRASRVHDDGTDKKLKKKDAEEAEQMGTISSLASSCSSGSPMNNTCDSRWSHTSHAASPDPCAGTMYNLTTSLSNFPRGTSSNASFTSSAAGHACGAHPQSPSERLSQPSNPGTPMSTRETFASKAASLSPPQQSQPQSQAQPQVPAQAQQLPPHPPCAKKAASPVPPTASPSASSSHGGCALSSTASTSSAASNHSPQERLPETRRNSSLPPKSPDSRVAKPGGEAAREAPKKKKATQLDMCQGQWNSAMVKGRRIEVRGHEVTYTGDQPRQTHHLVEDKPGGKVTLNGAVLKQASKDFQKVCHHVSEADCFHTEPPPPSQQLVWGDGDLWEKMGYKKATYNAPKISEG